MGLAHRVDEGLSEDTHGLGVHEQNPLVAQPEAPAEAGPEPPPADVEPAATPADRRARRPIRQDNVFGTPEQDAFRRDFTVNALFYDVGTFSIIDYVGGLEDLRAGLVRSIGDPNERFVEDPVRMLRAIALAARLDFRVDPPIYAAIARHRGEIAHSSPARLLEELYKILRSGAGERTFKGLAEVGLLEPIAREIHEHRSLALWQSLAELDMYRSRFDQAPDALTNPILLGSLVAPTQELTAEPRGTREGGGKRPLGVTLGVLPVARRDVDRLRHLLALQERLRHPDLPGRAQQALRHRSAFAEAFTWLEIHGRSPDLVAQWRSLTRGEPLPAPTAQEHALDRPSRRRRRRRRRPRPAPAA